MKTSRRLYIKTYGCQMNVYDSDKIADLLKPIGYEITEDPKEANLAILNTCHIREKAENKVMSDLGRLHKIQKKKEDYVIAVGGCVAQAQGEELLRQAPYVSIIFGPQTYHRLPEFLIKLEREKGISLVDTEFPIESKFDYLVEQSQVKSSAFLTIQEGCDKFCTFCCVPYTRGAEYSRPVKDIIGEAIKLAKCGAKEITLLGQNVNAFHGEAPYQNQYHTTKEWGLGRLIEYLVEEVPSIERIRYTTSHPKDMDDELIEVHGRVAKLMPYLHLPVQSGSNKILKHMNRKHTIEEYKILIDKFKAAKPDLVISSDFIAGYPGESQEDHQATLSLIHDYIDTGFAFKYSPRPGTPASVMNDQIDDKIKDERLDEILSMLRLKQLAMNQRSVGKTMLVLVEKKGKKEGQLIGKSPYLQSVCIEGNQRLINSIVPVKIEEAYQNSLMGTICTSEEYVRSIVR